MVFPNFDPYVLGLHYGDFGLRWYALAYLAGILLGWRYASGLTRNARLWGTRTPTATPPQIDDLILWITLGVIGGGRLGYILFYMLTRADQRALIAEHPLELIKVWHGGMSFHGGLIGVMLAVAFFARANKLDLLRVGDLVAPAVPIGLFFGRLANFIHGELWGRATDAAWGVVFCNQRIMEANGGYCPAGDAPRHPSQLYEALLEGVLLFLILRVATHRLKWLQRQGGVSGLFLLCYGLFRISLENVREPDAGLNHLPLGLTMGILLSVPMVAGGAWLVWRAARAAPPVEAAATPPAA